VRAGYVTDADLARMSEQFRPGLTLEQIERADRAKAEQRQLLQAAGLKVTGSQH